MNYGTIIYTYKKRFFYIFIITKFYIINNNFRSKQRMISVVLLYRSIVV